MRGLPPLPPDFETWNFDGGQAAARSDVADAVREALACGSLYAWAASRPDSEAFQGRGAAYGVSLGGVPSVVRHARRGGMMAAVIGDRYFGPPRFPRELRLSRRLGAAGIPSPALLAGVVYRAMPGHRSDVASVRVPGRDLASLLYGPVPAAPVVRDAALEATARLVRRLHAEGLVHDDLHVRNILVHMPEEGPPVVNLLDVDTCREAGEAGRVLEHNVARLFRSWEKWNRRVGMRLGPAERELFLNVYRGGGP